jgi:vacuolar protein sorting-associated protein 72
MSDDEQSDSGSDRDDLGTTGLIATRAKRSTAGNLYATLRQNLDDEELQNELLAEDEEDAGDYEGSDPEGDDDEAMESSSDDGDGGSPKDGDQDELDGEKELKKAERADAKKRKRMQAARMRIPAWQRSKKRVQLAGDARSEDGPIERPKKKGDRASWLPTDADGPTRQSSRASAVQNREMTNASLKESAARSEKQKTQSQRSQERERLKRRVDLTPEERMAKAMRVEKETAREFGRWEREEAERQRIRDEQLAAKRKRGIEGPIQRFWSGSVLWKGEHIKIRRIHGHKAVEVTEEAPHAREGDEPGQKDDTIMADVSNTVPATDVPGLARVVDESGVPSVDATAQAAPSISVTLDVTQATSQLQPEIPVPVDIDENSATLRDAKTQVNLEEVAVKQQSQTLLDGIQAYTDQPPSTDFSSSHIGDSPSRIPFGRLQLYFPSAPILHGDVYHANNHVDFSVHSLDTRETLAVPAIPSEPLIQEQAQRSLLILEQFSHLENSTTSVRRATTKVAKEVMVGPTPLASTLAPDAYPGFAPEEFRYLIAKMRKRGAEQLLPPAPAKTKCALTSWPAKFRDPRTDLPYADLQAYKLIQRILAGGCTWSSVLGAWVGPAYGEMGRPARGVPSGFGHSPVAKKATPVASIKHESTE